MKSMKIYVSCAAERKGNVKHGRWIDANQSQPKIIHEIESMVAECFAQIPCLVNFINEHGELGKILLSRYGYDTAKSIMDETYEGQYCSEYEFAEEMVARAVPKEWRMFFNMDKFMDDLFRYEYFKIETRDAVHVFKI